MNFLALLGALLLNYYRPHSKPDWVQQIFLPYAAALERNFNGGRSHQGVIAWVFGVFLPALLVGIAHYLLLQVQVLLGLLFGIFVLYYTLRFSHFGQQAEQIIAALRSNKLEEARELLTHWEAGRDPADTAEEYNSAQIARVSIETTLRRSHHGLFAPIFWFVILGPAGALLYRLAHLFQLQWQHGEDSRFSRFSHVAFDWLDWLPARITAGSFAIVGDFEDAVFCWRTQAPEWADRAMGIILASGAGALGVKLGEPLPKEGILQFRPELGLGDEADADYLQSAIGLVWRVLILLVGLLLLLTFAHWLGH